MAFNKTLELIKMNKAEALARLPELDHKGAHFANINTAKDVWWLDIPISKIESVSQTSLTLLLHDARAAKLHVLQVPTAFLSTNFRSLAIRKDKGMASLELSSETDRFLLNTRPGNSGLKFAPSLINSISVGHL